jgi:flagellar export protein FliJ
VKRYDFRLESLLRVRKIQQDLAASALAVANRATIEHEQALAHSRHQLRGAASTAAPPTSVAAFTARVERTAGAARAVVAGERALAATLELAAQRRGEWTERARRVDGLHHLDARAREEHGREVMKDEERVVDDLITGRFRRHGR